MSDLNQALAAVLLLAGLGDLFIVLVPLRNLPSYVRLTMAGVALLLLALAGLLFVGAVKLDG